MLYQRIRQPHPSLTPLHLAADTIVSHSLVIVIHVQITRERSILSQQRLNSQTMVSTLFFRSLVSLLLLVSLADAAITLKLEKHHGNARSSNKRSHVPHARSNFVPRAPARGLEGAYNNRSDSLERVKSRPKRQNEEEEARWAALLAQLTPPSDPSSTTASGSGSSDHPASNPAPTYPAESNVGPAKLEEAATPYTPPADTVLYPTTTESTTSTSTVFTDSYPSPTYSLDSSAASPLPSQDISEGPFDDDDGATIPLYSPHDVTYTIVVQVAGQPLNLVVRLSILSPCV